MILYKQLQINSNFLLGLLILSGLKLVNSEQCAIQKSITNIIPYCNNATRTSDYKFFTDDKAKITCSNTIYANSQFSVTNLAEELILTTGGSVTYPAYIDGFYCNLNNVPGISETCMQKCGAYYFAGHLAGSGLYNYTHLNCTGDPWYYAGNRGNVSTLSGATVLYPECYCVAVHGRTTWQNYKAKGNTWCREKIVSGVSTALPLNASDHDFYNIDSAMLPVREFTEPYFEFDGWNVYARTKTDCNCFLQAKKESWSKLSKFVGSEAFLRVDDIALIKSGYLYVMIIDDDGQEYEQTFPITGNVICRLHDCVLCKEAFTSFHCLPVTLKIVFWLTLSILILLTLCLCPLSVTLIIAFIKNFGKITWWFIRLPKRILSSNFVKKLKAGLRNVKSEILDEENQNLINNTDVNIQQTNNKNSFTPVINNTPYSKPSNSMSADDVFNGILGNTQQRKPMNISKVPQTSTLRTINVTTVLLILLPTVFGNPDKWGCSEVLSINSDAVSCSGIYPNRNNCTVHFQEELTFDEPMQKICREILDDKQRTIGYLEISLIQVEIVVDMSSIYYTSDFIAYGQSKHHCWLSDYCVGEICEQNYDDDPSTGNILTLADLKRYPGHGECERRDGCAANDCAICVDGCVFAGYAVVPQGTIFQVFEPLQVTLQPMILVNYTSGKGLNKVYTLNLDSLYTDTDFFQINVEGDFVSDEIIFNDYKVFTDGRNHYLNRGNDVNKFDPRVPGDLQGNNPLSMQPKPDGTKAAFAYGKENFVFTPEGKENILTYPAPGFANLLDTNKLPRVYSGYTWVFDTDGKLRANKTDKVEVKLTLETTANFTYVDYVTSVCPKVSNYISSGCYSCDLGSNVNITMKSICDSGIIRFSVQDPDITLLTTSTQITTFSNDYLIEFLTTKQTNSFDLLIMGSSSNVTINVNFTAVQIDQVNTNQTYVYDKASDEPSHSGGLGGFRKWLDDALLGRGHWLAYLLIGTVVSIIIIVIAFLFKKNKHYFSPKMWTKKMN